MASLKGNVAVVTGGGRGIGKEVCRQLAKKGAQVIVNYSRSKDAAESLVSELNQDLSLIHI